jgi:hypothetical protein
MRLKLERGDLSSVGHPFGCLETPRSCFQLASAPPPVRNWCEQAPIPSSRKGEPQ